MVKAFVCVGVRSNTNEHKKDLNEGGGCDLLELIGLLNCWPRSIRCDASCNLCMNVLLYVIICVLEDKLDESIISNEIWRRAPEFTHSTCRNYMLANYNLDAGKANLSSSLLANLGAGIV